jgi:phosphatidylglycerophosphatase GEP4
VPFLHCRTGLQDTHSILTVYVSVSITASLALHRCIARCAGLEGFDDNFKEAARVEAALQVPVLRHRDKKPAGGAADAATALRCAPHELVVVGDRRLTDVVFGNLAGAITVLVAPADTARESAVVRAARRLEGALGAAYERAGVRAPPHPLVVSDADLAGCVRCAVTTGAPK